MTRSGLIKQFLAPRIARLREISAVTATVTAVVVPSLLIGMAGCGGGSGDSRVAVPRPEAYPRVVMPDSSYVDLPMAGGVTLRVNEGAGVNVSSRDGAEWVDIRYKGVWGDPGVYLTVTCAQSCEVDEVMANRRERMALNLGGQRYELTELTSAGGWECMMAVARGSLTTPVQILARKDGRVISGALVLTLPDADGVAPDPVAFAPVVDAVERDMLTLLKSL